MDAEWSAAVIEVFVRLYEKQLIYRGNYIINWAPALPHGALRRGKREHVETAGKLYYLRYPAGGGARRPR